MSSDLFSYDEAHAAAAVTDLHSIISGLQSNLDQLQGYVSKVSSQWEGDEQVLYHGVQTRWNTAADAANEILAQMRTALEENTSSVRQMRAQIKGALSHH